MEENNKYRVSIVKMTENHKTTYWVCLDKPDRPIDADPWTRGRITPYKSEIKSRAVSEAKTWANFLNTEVSK